MTTLSQRLREYNETHEEYVGPRLAVIDEAADRLDALAKLRLRIERVFAEDVENTDSPCDGAAEGLCYQCARVGLVRDLYAPKEPR